LDILAGDTVSVFVYQSHGWFSVFWVNDSMAADSHSITKTLIEFNDWLLSGPPFH
jgi:hypothetical protein